MKSLSLLAFCFIFLGISCVKAVDPTATNYPFSFTQIVYSDDEVAFLLSLDSVPHRSADGGQIWNSVLNILPNSTDRKVSQILQDNVDKKKIFLLSDKYNVGWVTLNAGNSYSFAPLGFYSDGFLFHPSKSGWILSGGSWNPSGAQDVYFSQDMGLTWSLILQARDIEWAKDGGNIIFLVSKDGSFGYTPDFGKTFSPLFKNILRFVFTTKHLFIEESGPDSTIILKVSSGDHTKITDYQEVQFPFGERLPANQYNFLDDTTGAEWIGVMTKDNKRRNWGTIYTSGPYGRKYTTSLQHAHINGIYYDFDVFQGLEGIYLANIVSNYAQESGVVQLTTVITFDNGGEWGPLKAPAKDANGIDIECSGQCSLHLNGLTSWSDRSFGPFYSNPNAIGLLLGTGNVGIALATDASETNTYFSRDAGLTWFELLKGPHIYEFGDHGAVIVFADSENPTSEILYSLDEGLTLKRFTFFQNLVRVDNIISEPSGTSRKFVLYGTDHVTSQKMIVGLDFSKIQTRICGDSDYEIWTPTDGRRSDGLTCQLGRNTTYSRRKRDADCFNHPDTDHILDTFNCECVIQDYECDFGYEESTVSGQPICYLSTMNPPVYPPENCPTGTKYAVSSGYRKVAGDTCTPDIEKLQPRYADCPIVKGGDSSGLGAWAIVLIVLGVLATIGIAIFVVYKNERWRESILSTLMPGRRPGVGPYSRLGRSPLADEEFGIGGEHDLDDSDVQDDAPVLEDKDIQRATADKDKSNDDFNPRL